MLTYQWNAPLGPRHFDSCDFVSGAAPIAGDARRAAQERDAEFARQVAAQAISRYGFGGRGNGGNGGGGARVLRHTRFDDDGNASDGGYDSAVLFCCGALRLLCV